MTTLEERDELLVHGYIRKQQIDIPKEIAALCLIWYHFELYIFKAKFGVTLNENRTIIKQYSYGTCYGSVIMPSWNNNLIYEYTVKILEHAAGVAISCHCISFSVFVHNKILCIIVLKPNDPRLG